MNQPTASCTSAWLKVARAGSSLGLNGSPPFIHTQGKISELVGGMCIPHWVPSSLRAVRRWASSWNCFQSQEPSGGRTPSRARMSAL